VLNAASRETSRGFRLSKEKQSLKIARAVALSFAVVAAEQSGIPADIDDNFTDNVKVLSIWHYEDLTNG
jgi:hypothetical protein